jgi:hypothetical protein
MGVETSRHDCIAVSSRLDKVGEKADRKSKTSLQKADNAVIKQLKFRDEEFFLNFMLN